MIDFYRYKVIHDAVTDLSVDICRLLSSFVMDRHENNDLCWIGDCNTKDY